MTDKSVQKLSKRELLEILVSQGKQIEKLQEDLKLATAQLEDKEISIENAGSIAEASLMINNIFADADAACQQYLDNIMNLEQQQQEALDRINEKEAELDRRLQQTNSRAATGHRTMPTWTNSRVASQPQEEVADEGEQSWAPTQTQTRQNPRSGSTVRTVQTQAQAQAQPQNRATRTATTRAVNTAPRATATATVTRPTVVTRTAQAAPAARVTTVTRPTTVRQTAPAANVTAAPKTKRRVS